MPCENELEINDHKQPRNHITLRAQSSAPNIKLEKF